MNLRRPVTLLALTVAVGAATACSGGTAGAGDNVTPRSSANRLSQAEMAETTARTLLQAIQQLRPMWLRPRGTDPGSGASLRPVVFVDGVRAGDLNMLDQIRIEEVEGLRYYNARDATTRWGTGVAGGVIEVYRVRG